MSRLSDHEGCCSTTITSLAIGIPSNITANSSIPMLVTETSKGAALYLQRPHRSDLADVVI